MGWSASSHVVLMPTGIPAAAPDLLTLAPLAFSCAEVFLLRVERLRQWLAARPERSLAVVTHWGVLEALTGKEFRNCEVHTLRLRQLRARPHLLRREAAAATAGER